jgi:mRNA interferase YafQ
MTLKKTASQRRAKLPLRSDYTKTFEKDWERYCRDGKVDMHRLKEAIVTVIANEWPLEAEWRDHELVGKPWTSHRELHVGGDLLLIYKLAGDGVVFVRLGTHSELFGR